MSSARDWTKGSKPIRYEGAPRGMVKNAPHNDLPPGAVAYLRNAHAYPTEFQPRLASWLYSETQPPVLTDNCGENARANYSASKSGNLITATENIFLEADVSRYWVWPGDPNFHDEIIGYVSPTEVRTRDSGDRGLTNGCWMHAKLNLNVFHDTVRRFVRQWGSEVYVSTDLTLGSWTRAHCITYDQPNDSISDWDIMDDYLVIDNSNGTFLLMMDVDPPVMFKKNTIVPAVLPSSVERTADTDHRYDYIYSMSRLSGTGIRDRASDGVLIVQESGTVALNQNTDPPRDYGVVWSESMVNDGIQTQGRLVCGIMAAAQQTPTYWNGQNDITFQLTVNGITENFLIDMSATNHNVETMQDVASVIQTTVRTVFPFFTAAYTGGRFIFTSGEQDGSTMGYGQAGVGGTDHSALMLITEALATSLSNSYAYSGPIQVGIFTVPKIPVSPDNPEWHWTHYTVYRSEDNGPDGIVPRTNEATWEDLPPLKLTWVKDYRVAGAFLASKDVTGLITAHVGEFERADEGTPFVWEDGTVDTLYTYIDSTHMTGNPTGVPVSYYEGGRPSQAAAIGGGRVIRASQIGNLITRTHGDVFTVNDERKPLTWADGTYSIATCFVDANHMFAADSTDRGSQGLTLDPISRVVSDNVSDAKLRDRQGELHTGLLGHRFWREMPNTNVLAIVPGHMIKAIRDSSDCYYCQMGPGLKYLSGYYLPNRQKLDRIEGNIRTIVKMPNKFIVFCAQNTWGGPTNNPTIVELPEFGEFYSQLYADIIDNDIGVVDIGSIQQIDFGLLEMRCTDNSWRKFNGMKYGEDLTADPDTGQDRIKEDFEETQSLGASIFGDLIGHIWWGRQV